MAHRHTGVPSNTAHYIATMPATLISLTLRMGAWGESGPHPGAALTEPEHKALAAELRRRQK